MQLLDGVLDALLPARRASRLALFFAIDDALGSKVARFQSAAVYFSKKRANGAQVFLPLFKMVLM